MPTYNQEDFISESIESVLNQTFVDFELIVIDNASIDGTSEIVKNYVKKDSRISYIRNDTNIGMYPNFNKGFLKANYKYIKYINSDDKFNPELLEKFTNIMEEYPSVKLVTSNRSCFGDRNEIITSEYSGIHKGEDIIFQILLKIYNFIGEPTTTMFRSEDIIGGVFNLYYTMFADLDLWLRLICNGNIYFVNETLSSFRIHKGQGTQYLNDSKFKELNNTLELLFYSNIAIKSNWFQLKSDSRSLLNSNINSVINGFRVVLDNNLKSKTISEDEYKYLIHYIYQVNNKNLFNKIRGYLKIVK